MATLSIEETFELPAPPDRVFAYLVDPERVVVCLPGASLDERVDDTTYEGRITVSLGAVTVSYRGTAEFVEVDEEARRVRLEATGREKAGTGSARMTMRSRVEERDGGGSVVTVESEVEVAGKIVRFGRGMIERLSTEIFKDFTACLEERLGAGAAEASPSAGEDEVAQEGDAAREGQATEEGEEGREPASRAATGGEGEEDDGLGSGVGAPRAEHPSVSEAAEAGASLEALPLLFRALGGAVRDFFRRLFGAGG